jgi:hypothetical protein
MKRRVDVEIKVFATLGCAKLGTRQQPCVPAAVLPVSLLIDASPLPFLPFPFPVTVSPASEQKLPRLHYSIPLWLPICVPSVLLDGINAQTHSAGSTVFKLGCLTETLGRNNHGDMGQHGEFTCLDRTPLYIELLTHILNFLDF